MDWQELISGRPKAPSKRIGRAAQTGLRLEPDKVTACRGGRNPNQAEEGQFDLAEVQRIERETRPKNRKNGRPIAFNIFRLFGG